MVARVVDYSALTAPVAAADVAAWRARARSSGAAWATTSAATVIGIAAAVVAGLIVVFVGGGILAAFLVAGLQNGNLFGILFPMFFVGLVVAVLAAAARNSLRGGGKWTRWFRLDRFARANGMAFTPIQGDPGYPGEIFQLGRDRAALDHLVTTAGRFMDLGNLRYTTGSGKSETVHSWGFLALKLDRRMPNIVLDSKANNGFFGTNLPAVLDRSQILHLEGDFDRHFTLYCPRQYEQDALYIFTPDLMALLIDEASPFDVELVDDWMFVYASRPFDMTSPAALQRLFTIADTVGAKALDQTEHYADARVGDFVANIVAPQGARLKRGVSVLGVVVVVAFAVFWGWGFFGKLLGG